ncbi:MAG: alpha-isopropylmalate synthase regulatory domain-containing protein [Rickettsiales bacterium]
MEELGMKDALESDHIDEIVKEIKQRETEGYAYEDADASFELMVHRRLTGKPLFFEVPSYRVLGERRFNGKGERVNMSEATTKITVDGEMIMTVAEGNGPVDALDKALRKALVPKFKQLEHMRLTDYKVRILASSDATEAVTRVMIESRDDKGNVWNTIGVSPNVIDASFMALNDSITYCLLRGKKK